MVPAQERVLDKAAFDSMMAAGHDHKVKWKDEKYRLTVTTSSKVTGRPQTDHSSKNVTEFGPSMETRTIYTNVFGGKAGAPRESLRIGNWWYVRTGNDPWTREEYVALKAPAKKEETSRKVLSSNAEYKYLGKGMLGARPVQIYVKTERQTTLNEKSGETGETASKNTYWIDGKGMILKSEFTSEYRGKNVMHTSVTMEWDLDPTITFIAPEIAP